MDVPTSPKLRILSGTYRLNRKADARKVNGYRAQVWVRAQNRDLVLGRTDQLAVYLIPPVIVCGDAYLLTR